MTLRLYTDGSRNEETKVVGWGYSLMDGNTVLLAECGVTSGSSTHGENLAIIHGLLAIPPSTPVIVVTDRDDIGDMMNTRKLLKSKKSVVCSQRRAIQRLADKNTSFKIIMSGEDKRHRQVDTLARYACGLPSKKQRKNAANRARKDKKRRVNAEAQACFQAMSRTIETKEQPCNRSSHVVIF